MLHKYKRLCLQPLFYYVIMLLLSYGKLLRNIVSNRSYDNIQLSSRNVSDVTLLLHTHLKNIVYKNKGQK